MSSRRNSCSAFTLIELLVVVAIIALLISILLPSLQGARDQAKKAYCLSNMRSMAQASTSYAAEDKKEPAVPIHLAYSNPVTVMAQDFPDEWWFRTAQASSFGGRSAQVPFPTGRAGEGSGTASNAMMEADEGNPPIPSSHPELWGAKTRPMNKYMVGSSAASDAKKFENFHCPADIGMPGIPELPASWLNRETSSASGNIPFYDLVGNSYRLNVAGQFRPGSYLSFTVAPVGHRLSSIQNTGRLILFAEPMVYLFSRQEPGIPDPDILGTKGWHKTLVSDNAAFVDGSARTLKMNELANWPSTLLQQMEYIDANGGTDFHAFLRRGNTWQTDCYPTPGAFMSRRATVNGTFAVLRDLLQGSYNACVVKWPFRGFQNNIND